MRGNLSLTLTANGKRTKTPKAFSREEGCIEEGGLVRGISQSRPLPPDVRLCCFSFCIGHRSVWRLDRLGGLHSHAVEDDERVAADALTGGRLQTTTNLLCTV